MKEIELTQGKVALVDDEDYEYLNQWKWHVKKSKNIFYAARNAKLGLKRITVKMHRVIMKTPDHLQVDHKDRDGLNNRKRNLRNTTSSVNNQNKKSWSLIGYKGVSYCLNRIHCFKSECGINNKKVHIGYFKTAKKAAIAYDKKALELYGENAYLNFKQ